MPTISLKYPADFYLQGFNNFYPGLGVKLYDYTAGMIEEVLKSGHNDLIRIAIQFDNQESPQSYRDLSKVIVQAKTNGIDLTAAEVKAIYAFACSVNGIAQQGGYFSLTELLVKHIFRFAGLPPSDQSTGYGSYYHVRRSGGQIILTHIYRTDSVQGYHLRNKDKKSPDLILKTEEFILTEKNGLFSCQISENYTFELEKGYFNSLIPAIRKRLEGKLDAEAYFYLIPFLANESVRDKFIASLAAQNHETQEPIRELIKLCFAKDKKFLQTLLAKYDKKILLKAFPKAHSPQLPPQSQLTSSILTSAPTPDHEAKMSSFTSTYNADGDSKRITLVPFAHSSSSSTLDDSDEMKQENHDKEDVVLPEKKPGQTDLPPAFKHAMDNLNVTIKRLEYGQDLISAAQCVVDEIMLLPLAQITADSALLTRILIGTDNAIRTPQDLDNLQQLQVDLKTVKDRNWHKLALAIATVAIGAVVLVLSAITLAASFGSSFFFSSWGIGFSSSALTKGFSVIGMAAGIGVMAVGVGFSEDQPLKKVYLAGHTFFTRLNSPKLAQPEELKRDSSRPTLL
jgi:hypothetical protein